MKMKSSPALILVALALATGPVYAQFQTVVVESKTTNGTMTPNPPYQEIGDWLDSFTKSTAPGLSSTNSRFSATNLSAFVVSPTLDVAGGTYSVEVTQAGLGSQSTNIIVSIEQIDCFGLPTLTAAFQRHNPNQWKSVGNITLAPGATQPKITFTCADLSGQLSPENGFYSDSIRFVQQEQVVIESHWDWSTVNTNAGSGYVEVAGNWLTSSNKSNAIGLTSPRVRFTTSAATNIPSFKIQPTLAKAGGIYAVEVTQAPVNQSTSIIVAIEQTGCTGLPTNTTAFQRTTPNVWKSVGTVQLNPGVTTPEITFTYSSGALGPSSRFYFDAIRFTRLDIPPSITLHPISQSANPGGLVTFTAAASGAPTIFYQWRKNDNIIDGATNASLTLTNVQTGDLGDYFVDASNGYGQASSVKAALSLNQPPAIIAGPQNKTVSVDSTVTFSVQASGSAPLNYQWRFNGENISGATQSSYSLTGVQATNGGGYQVVVSNAVGSILSQTALLTVNSGNLQTLFSDDFDSDSSAAWIINRSSTDTRVTFNYDYSALGIPAAPNSTGGTTRGVKLEANLTNGTRAAINISPLGQQFSGDYRLHFDMWINANGPFPLGGAGSAQHLTAGIATTGNRVQWTNNSSADGYWFAVDGEGNPTGSLAAFPDFVACRSNTLMTAATGVYAAGTSSDARDNTNAYYTTTFPGGQVPPLLQQTNFAQQTGGLAKGAVGFKWRDVLISREGSKVEWFIDGLKIAAFTNASSAQGNIFVGYWDAFASLSDNPQLSFGLVDNLRVERMATAPFIVQQPQNQTVVQNQSASFAVEAGGTQPLFYQWKVGGTNIANATSSSLTLSNAQPTDAGEYSVVITNSAGSVVSSNAVLTVQTLVPVSIVTQPQSITVDGGDPALFTVEAEGTLPRYYQWRKNELPIAGATNSSFNIATTQLSDIANYRVVVSNAVNSVTSSVAALTFSSKPYIATHPQSQTVPLGSNVSFSVNVIGPEPMIYQWRHNGANLTNNDYIAGANTPGLTLNSTAIGDGGNYSVMVSNAEGERISQNAMLRFSSTQSVFLVESRINGGAVTNTSPPYQEIVGAWANSTLKSTTPGVTTSVGSRFATVTNAAFKVMPALQAGKSYVVQMTHGNATSVSTNIVVGITQSNCFGLPATTTAFNRTVFNKWETLGTITTFSDEPMPEITFTYLSGNTDVGAPNRFYADAIRFVDTDEPCLFGLPQLPPVTGPLAAGQTFVNVAGAHASAAKISVYANGILIGEKTNGIVAGLNTVVTAPLIKGQQITATQTDGEGVESCRAVSGSSVGGGANPRIRAALSIRMDQNLTGPIGASGGPATSAPLMMLGSTGPTGGFGTAPIGGRIIEPGTCWQTVSFLRGPEPTNSVDPTYGWFAGHGTNDIFGNFGVLDAIAFSIEDTTDSGPYEIYIDNLKNGDTVIQDFESAIAGANEVTFKRPAYSLTTVSFLLANGHVAPNVSTVSAANADTGNNSLFVNWQFGSTNAVNWLRLSAHGNGVAFPMVDLRQPISFRILLLPVGETAGGSLHITSQPASQERNVGEQVSFSVEASGTGSLSYQWRFNGTNISGATGNSLTLNNLQTSDAGDYSVVVQSPTCSLTSESASLAVNVIAPSIVSHPTNRVVIQGDEVSFTVEASGSQPLFYQWRFNGENIPSATDSIYTLSNVQTNHGGRYSVLVSNAANFAISDEAILSFAPPSILQSPQSQLVDLGGTAQFTVSATGATPLSYQWSLNGTNIPGATASSLTLHNIQPGDLGSYSVSVENFVGTTNSQPATLSLLQPFVLLHPEGGEVERGDNVTLSVFAVDGVPLTYQWYRNGRAVPRGTSPSLTLKNFQPWMAAEYVVEVGNGTASVASSVAELTLKQRAGIVVGNSLLGAPVSDAISVAAGWSFGLALRKDGTVVTDHVIATNIAGISVGTSFALFLRKDGTVEGWSSPISETNNPVLDIPSGLSNVVQVAAGDDYGMALLRDGNVVAWGRSIDLSTWTNMVAIDASAFYRIGLRDDGTVAVSTTQDMPSTGLTNIVAVDAHGSYLDLGFGFHALKDDGTVITWPTLPEVDWGNDIIALDGFLGLRKNKEAFDFQSWNVFFTNAIAIAQENTTALAIVLQEPEVTSPTLNRIVRRWQQDIVFEVTATGSDLSYQWRLNGLPIVGATNASLIVSIADTNTVGVYEVIVSNELGSETKQVATLSLDVPADFNGDFESDILFQNSNGSVAAWFMNGTGFLGSAPLKKPAAGWHLSGQGDFNADSNSDFLWQHTDGRLALWFMEGTNFLRSVLLNGGQPVQANWRVMAAGDINGDYQPDLLFQNADGSTAIWQMDGTNRVSSVILRGGTRVAAGWQIAGMTDLDGDGRRDILWNHAQGQIAVWYMSGTDFLGSALLNGSKPVVGWRLVGAADFNQDAKSDLLWQSDDGRVAVWFMNGAGRIGTVILRDGKSAGQGWQIVGPR